MQWIEEMRIGAWNYDDWKECLTWATPSDQTERLRRATQLGEPLGSGEFMEDLELTAGRRLRVGPRGTPVVEKASVAAVKGHCSGNNVVCPLFPFPNIARRRAAGARRSLRGILGVQIAEGVVDVKNLKLFRLSPISPRFPRRFPQIVPSISEFTPRSGFGTQR